MNLFRGRSETPDAETIQQIKQWVDQLLQLEGQVPISVSQLRCHEPDCPPVETAITVLTQPPQLYKVHLPLADVDQAALQQALDHTLDHTAP